MVKFVTGLVVGLILGAIFGGSLQRGLKERRAAFSGENVHGALSNYGIVIKEKAREAGTVIADATADARATAAIKTKFATELRASTIADISVSTSDGIVTLAGSVASKEDLHKAVEIAYAIDGVRKVYSTLQVKEVK